MPKTSVRKRIEPRKNRHRWAGRKVSHTDAADSLKSAEEMPECPASQRSGSGALESTSQTSAPADTATLIKRLQSHIRRNKSAKYGRSQPKECAVHAASSSLEKMQTKSKNTSSPQ